MGVLRTEISTAYHRKRVGQWKRYALERLAMKKICFGTAGKAWKGGLKGRTYLYCQYTWVPPPPPGREEPLVAWIYRTEVRRTECGISRWRVEHRVHYFGPQMHKQPCIVCFIQLPPPTELPPKSQWIMELYSYLHAHASVLTVTRE